MQTYDFAVEDHGTIWTFEAITKPAREFSVEAFADATSLGLAYVVEHRFAPDIVGDLLERGFTLTVDDHPVELRRKH